MVGKSSSRSICIRPLGGAAASVVAGGLSTQLLQLQGALGPVSAEGGPSLPIISPPMGPPVSVTTSC
eukprot:8170673-Heterocapsa_arctica.AAC.1